MTISPRKAKKTALKLLRENRRGRSWRVIARDYPGVNFATLNRFAIHKGEWLPADEKILISLGLKKPCLPKPEPAPIPEWVKPIKKRIAMMAKQTRQSILENLS